MSAIDKMFGIEKVGIWWLKEEMSIKDNETKAYAWWGICKKTKKVAFMRLVTNTIYEVLPLLMNDIYMSKESCDDGKYCLNLECPHNPNTTLITPIIKQVPLYKELDEKDTVDYFKRSFNFITKEFIEGLSESQLNKIFTEDYTACTVNENAFETTVG